MINPFVFTKKEDVVVLDIRDNSVEGMILSLDRGGQEIPEKIFNIKKEISFQSDFNHKRLFYATSKALVSVANSMIHSGFKLPKKIFCVIGPHLYVSQTRIIKIKYERPVTISAELIRSLIEEDIKQFEKKHLDLGGSSSNTILEHKIMQIRLNGYETDSPIKKTATEIEISIFVSMSPNLLINDLKKIISNNLHINKIDFHSFTFALSDVIRNMSLDKRGFVVIDIEGEISEISIIRNNIVEDTVSFPMGFNFLTRKIINRFNISNEQALSYLKLFVSGSGDKEIMDKMSEIIENTRIEWSELFYQTLKKISYHRLLPDTFYVLTEQMCKDISFDFIKKADVSGLLVMNRPPSVECLDPKVFSSLCKNISECPDDVHSLVNAIFTDNFYKHTSSYLK